MSCVRNSLLNMTLYVSCWVGISSFHQWPYWVGPFIFSFHLISVTSAWPPILWIQKLPNSRIMLPKCSRVSPYVVTLTPDPMYHMESFACIFWWYGIHHDPPLTWSLPVDFNSLSRKLADRIPSSTLELACPNGKFFALNDKFTSLLFDRVISRVFNISSFIHIPWTMLRVPWGPFSLLVVSLTLVNGSHHWLVIKRIPSMFDFYKFIFMLGFVLWSGHLERKTLG